MSIVLMKCKHAKHKGETWALELGDEKATIKDAADAVRAEFNREQAAAWFKMPSFSESIKEFRAPVDGELWFFDVAKPDLKTIKEYLDHSLVVAGPEAIIAVKKTALRDLVVGVGATVVGIGLTVGTYLEAARKPEGGTYTVTYGLVIFGLAAFGRGIYGLMQYGKLRKLSDEASFSG